MINPLKWVSAGVWNRLRRHPVSSDLVAYRDGELPQSSHERIESHLRGCAVCRKEMISLAEDLLYFDQLTSGVDLEMPVRAGLLKMQEAMDSYAPEALQIPASNSELLISPMLLSSIQAELAIYLGARAAERLLARPQLMKSAPRDLVSTIEPLMASLIGVQGAVAVAQRLDLLCESAGLSGPSQRLR